MHDLTKLTKRIRAEGLTPENRARIRAAHAELTKTQPSPAVAPATVPDDNASSAAKASREAMLDRSNTKHVSRSAAEARQRMIERGGKGGEYASYNVSGYDG